MFCSGCLSAAGGIILATGFFESKIITAYGTEEFVLPVDNIIICSRGMGQNISAAAVALGGLTAEQISILGIRLGIDVKGDKGRVRNGNHVVEAKQTKAATIQLHKMLAGLEVCMIGLGGLHGYKVAMAADKEDNTHVWPAAVFVILNAGITAFKEADIAILHTINFQLFHFYLSKKERRRKRIHLLF